MIKGPQVSFVIPCFQCRRTVGFTIQSILAQKTNLSYEIVVAESSPQEISSWVRSAYPSVRVVKGERRLYAGAARNLGARHARGEYLAFVDADVRLESEWLEKLFARLTQTSEISLVGAAVRNANSESSASRILYWIEFSEFQPGSKSGKRAAISSSNLLLRRKDFLEAGGFDEEWGMCEDLLFCKALSKNVFFESACCVYHQHRSRWSQAVEHLRELGYWSGRLRRAFHVKGSGLFRFPLLSFLLPFWRMPRIAARIFANSRRDAMRLIIDLPLLLIGLFFWAKGFYQGIGARQD